MALSLDYLQQLGLEDSVTEIHIIGAALYRGLSYPPKQGHSQRLLRRRPLRPSRTGSPTLQRHRQHLRILL